MQERELARSLGTRAPFFSHVPDSAPIPLPSSGLQPAGERTGLPFVRALEGATRSDAHPPAPNGCGGPPTRARAQAARSRSHPLENPPSRPLRLRARSLAAPLPAGYLPEQV